MADELGAVGDLVTGVALARAAEPVAGEGVSVTRAVCANCGAALDGAFCARCGQKAEVHRTLTAFWHDILHSVLHFDGKIWRTLPLLAWRPGELTRRYVHGERARFVSPLALFLFSVFLTFAAFSWVMPTSLEIDPDAPVRAERELVTGTVRQRADIANLEAQRKAATGEAAASLDRELAAARAALRISEQTAVFVGERRAGATSARLDTGNPQIDAAITKATANPQLLFYKVQSNAYKFSWALIPLSLPMVWLLFFWRPEFHLFDHAVFVTYSLCFMLLLLVAMAIPMQFAATAGLAAWVLTIVPPVHMFRQLKGAYGLGWLGALWRTLAMTIFALIALIVFVIALIAMGIAG